MDNIGAEHAWVEWRKQQWTGDRVMMEETKRILEDVVREQGTKSSRAAPVVHIEIHHSTVTLAEAVYYGQHAPSPPPEIAT